MMDVLFAITLSRSAHKLCSIADVNSPVRDIAI